MPNVLIITWTPLSKFAYKKVYGFNDLEKKYKVIIFYVGKLIFKNHLNNLYNNKDVMPSTLINSYEEIDEVIKKKDFRIIINLTGIREKHILFKEIIKRNIKIINFINVPILDNYFYPKKFVNSSKYIFKFFFSNINPLSKNLIGGKNFNNYYNSIKSKILYSHSLNYNEYLINKKFFKTKKKGKKIISFIDSGFNFHPDFYLNKNRKIDKNKNFDIKKFSKKINKFFKDLNSLGYNINFLCHPKIKYNSQKIYKYCKKLRYKTLETIKKSDIVISCGSSTIEHAILFRKPILIINSKEINSYPVVKRSINLHNKYFNKRAFDIGTYKDIKDYKKHIILPSIKYKDYFYNFIKHPKSKNIIYSKLIEKIIKNSYEN